MVSEQKKRKSFDIIGLNKKYISTFEELDNDFKESTYRKTRYFVNKSNVSRTLITIVGEITFKRTYYVSKHSNRKFFYIDKVFDLPIFILGKSS